MTESLSFSAFPKIYCAKSSAGKVSDKTPAPKKLAAPAYALSDLALEESDRDIKATDPKAVADFFDLMGEGVNFRSKRFFAGAELGVVAYLDMSTMEIFSTNGKRIGYLRYRGWIDQQEGRKTYLWEVRDERDQLIGRVEIICHGRYAEETVFLSQVENCSTESMDERCDKEDVTIEVQQALAAKMTEPLGGDIRDFNRELTQALLAQKKIKLTTPGKKDFPAAEIILGERLIPLYYFTEGI